mgnify:CR=1 FL=1
MLPSYRLLYNAYCTYVRGTPSTSPHSLLTLHSVTGGETNNLNTTGTDTGPYLRIVIERYDKCMTRRETLVIVGCFRSTEKRPLSHMQSKRGGEG